MAKSAVSPVRDWGFLKGDHASAYKQLPVAHGFANLSAVLLMGPASGKWMGFSPNVLIFGPLSAVLHYNCFSRSLAVFAHRYLCIQMASYYDDSGALSPLLILHQAPETFTKFFGNLGELSNRDKSKHGDVVEFLGLKGPPLDQGRNVDKYILPTGENEKWPKILEQAVGDNSIDHKPLGEIIGELSITQISVFVRFGRAMLKPIYDKLGFRSYASRLIPDEIDILRWRID